MGDWGQEGRVPKEPVDMRVLVFDGPHRMHVERRRSPRPGRGEVRIRIARVGICGSDLHGYTGESGRRVAGMIMGHEAAGWIDAIGPDATGTVGQPVTFNPALPCDGVCGHTDENRCERLRVIGVTPDIQGAFADLVVVPATRVVPVDGIPIERAASVEPMAVALQAVEHLGIAEGERVLVIGGGMIGQCVAQAARLMGAGRVTVSDPMPERRALAEACGFESASPEDVERLGLFDRAVDAVGLSMTASSALRAVRPGGTVVFLGLGAPEVALPLFDIVVQERRILGSFCYRDEVFREAVTRVADGSLDVTALLGPVVPFEDAPSAFEDLAAGKRREVKILVTTDAVAPA
jgi:2-desacetyl-2-hydroxyethyl bacteriochlorophyllide A dehydrogenase